MIDTGSSLISSFFFSVFFSHYINCITGIVYTESKANDNKKFIIFVVSVLVFGYISFSTYRGGIFFYYLGLFEAALIVLMVCKHGVARNIWNLFNTRYDYQLAFEGMLLRVMDEHDYEPAQNGFRDRDDAARYFSGKMISNQYFSHFDYNDYPSYIRYVLSNEYRHDYGSEFAKSKMPQCFVKTFNLQR